MEAGFGYRRDAPSMGDIEALTYQGQRITDHGPEARAPISVAGLGRRQVGRRGSVGVVPEDGAWAEFLPNGLVSGRPGAPLPPGNGLRAIGSPPFYVPVVMLVLTRCLGRADRSAPSQCEMVTGPRFSLPNQPIKGVDRDLPPQYRAGLAPRRPSC